MTPTNNGEHKTNFLVSLVKKIHDFPKYSRPDLINMLAKLCAYNDEPLYVN